MIYPIIPNTPLTTATVPYVLVWDSTKNSWRILPATSTNEPLNIPTLEQMG